MKNILKLFLKTTIFLIPFAMILAFPFYVMWKAGEFTPARQILALHEDKQRLSMIVPAYSDYWSLLKLQAVRRRKPEVIALGTSRIMQMREHYFHSSFYNASRAVSDLSHFRVFLNVLSREQLPRVWIITLDPQFFNSKWVWSSRQKLFYKPAFWKEAIYSLGNNWVKVYHDYFSNKFNLGMLHPKNESIRKVGLTAIILERGFINDGSFYYLGDIKRTEKNQDFSAQKLFSEGFEAIRAREGVFLTANRISQRRIKILEDFLMEAKRRGIHVVAYIPPFAPSIYQDIIKYKTDYGYLFELEEKLQPIFAKYGFTFMDFHNPAAVKARDEEFVDPVHDSGEVTLRIFNALAKEDRILKSAAEENIVSSRPILPFTQPVIPDAAARAHSFNILKDHEKVSLNKGAYS